MYRLIANLPFSVLKVKLPLYDCFIDDGSVVDIAIQTGENTATIEEVKEEVQEQAEEVKLNKEEIERLREMFTWRDNYVDSLELRITGLETRLSDLETVEEITEEVITEQTTTEEEVTTVVSNKQPTEEPSQEETIKPNKRGVKLLGIL
jgi:predicted  nucleic acid-binding Zn-ribbon protein